MICGQVTNLVDFNVGALGNKKDKNGRLTLKIENLQSGARGMVQSLNLKIGSDKKYFGKRRTEIFWTLFGKVTEPPPPPAPPPQACQSFSQTPP